MLPLRNSLMHALRNRQLVLVLDNFEQVLPAARDVLELARRLLSGHGPCDQPRSATSAFTVGRAEWRLGHVETARAYLDEAERLIRTLGNPVMAARILYFQASLALEQGKLEATRLELAQALADLCSQGLRESAYI